MENGVKMLLQNIYPEHNHRMVGVVYEPNVPFTATLHLETQYEKRVKAVDVDTGTVYWMFTSYLTTLMADTVIVRGHVEAEWFIHKVGGALGVKLAGLPPA